MHRESRAAPRAKIMLLARSTWALLSAVSIVAAGCVVIAQVDRDDIPSESNQGGAAGAAGEGGAGGEGASGDGGTSGAAGAGGCVDGAADQGC